MKELTVSEQLNVNAGGIYADCIAIVGGAVGAVLTVALAPEITAGVLLGFCLCEVGAIGGEVGLAEDAGLLSFPW